VLAPQRQLLYTVANGRWDLSRSKILLVSANAALNKGPLFRNGFSRTRSLSQPEDSFQHRPALGPSVLLFKRRSPTSHIEDQPNAALIIVG